MSLLKCPYCGRRYYGLATTCGYCFARVSAARGAVVGLVRLLPTVAAVAAVAAAAWLVYAYAGHG